MKTKAMEWKKLAEEAANLIGSSSINLNNLVSEVLLSNGDMFKKKKKGVMFLFIRTMNKFSQNFFF